MKTMQAEYKTDIAWLAEDIAKWDKENNLRWLVGLWNAAIAVLGNNTRALLDTTTEKTINTKSIASPVKQLGLS